MNQFIGTLSKIIAPIITGFLGYLLGKQKKIDELQLQQAFPKAEEISTLMQEVYHEDMSFIDIWESNFGHLENFQQGINYFQERNIYQPDRDRIIALSEKRQELREKIRSSRVYLNAKTLNLIEDYLKINEFTFSYDGMGGILYTGYWREFFNNILDDDRIQKRKRLYQKIKKRLNKIYRV